MRKMILLVLLLSTYIASGFSQTGKNPVTYEIGRGLTVNLNNGQHTMNLSGFVQMGISSERAVMAAPQNRFNVNAAILQFNGFSKEDKLGYFFVLNFADKNPFSEAWGYYQPLHGLKISAGQRQVLTASRSVRYLPHTHALGNMSLSNRLFFAGARELGLFAEYRNAFKSFGYDLGLLVTSGDGRVIPSDRSVDVGGFKYGGNIAIYPLGFFTRANDRMGSDFVREKRPKLAIGFGYAYNVGASDPIGYGRKTIKPFAGKEGKGGYPDYQTLTADLLFKYNGLTFLAEYTNANVYNFKHLVETFGEDLKSNALANHYRVGHGLSFHAGYLCPGKWAIDASYSTVIPQYKEAPGKLPRQSEYRLGVGKYMVDNRAKIQLIGGYHEFPGSTDKRGNWSLNLLMHVVL